MGELARDIDGDGALVDDKNGGARHWGGARLAHILGTFGEALARENHIVLHGIGAALAHAWRAVGARAARARRVMRALAAHRLGGNRHS